MTIVILLVAATVNATPMNIGFATYQGSGYNLIYNTQNNSIWLTYSYSGTWTESMLWADSLNHKLSFTIKPQYEITWHDESEWMLPYMREPNPISSIQLSSPDVLCLCYHSLTLFENVEDGNYWARDPYRNAPHNMPIAYNPAEKVTIMDESYWSINYALAERKGSVTDLTQPVPVPEPATMLLFGTGIAGLVEYRRKFKK